MTEKENQSQFESLPENTPLSQPDSNGQNVNQPSSEGNEMSDQDTTASPEEARVESTKPDEPASEPADAGMAQAAGEENANQTGGEKGPEDSDKPVIPSVQALQTQAQTTASLNQEDDIEKEIQESLGDMSIMDMYGDLDDNTPDATALLTDSLAQAGTDEDPLPGINKGKVLSIADDGVFIDLGGKSQGFLPIEEIEEGEKVEIGMDMDVAILRYDQRDGLLILSRKSAQKQLLRKNLKEGALVEARVIGTNKGGLEMDIKGLRGFMPVSQIDIGRVEDMEPLVGERFVCEVIQVERGDKNIVLSRRNLLMKEVEEKRQTFWDDIEMNEVRQGRIRSIAEYGAFVDIGGVDGLLHVSELSWGRVEHPKDVLAAGQEVTVKVISLDRETQRIGLSMKQVSGDPWQSLEQRYQIGGRYQAQVAKLMDFGAFVELEPGVEGLIPISEMSWMGRIKHPSDVVQVGQMVDAEIIRMDAEKKRLSLSMKKVQGNPWSNVEEKYPKDSIVKGKVARLTDFGAFVTLEPGVDGLIHISELSDKHIAKVSDVLQEGDEIEAKVLSVESDKQRIGLTMKGLLPEDETAASPETTEEAESGEDNSSKKRKRPLRGGLTWGSQDIFKL